LGQGPLKSFQEGGLPIEKKKKTSKEKRKEGDRVGLIKNGFVWGGRCKRKGGKKNLGETSLKKNRHSGTKKGVAWREGGGKRRVKKKTPSGRSYSKGKMQGKTCGKISANLMPQGGGRLASKKRATSFWE